MTREEVKEKYHMVKAMHEHAQKLRKQLEQIESQCDEIMFVDNTLLEFSGLKKGDEILVPLANGIFVRAKLEDSKKAIVNVGVNTSVEQDIEETRKMLASQLSEATGYRDKIAQSIIGIEEKARKAEQEMLEIAKAIKEEENDEGKEKSKDSSKTA